MTSKTNEESKASFPLAKSAIELTMWHSFLVLVSFSLTLLSQRIVVYTFLRRSLLLLLTQNGEVVENTDLKIQLIKGFFCLSIAILQVLPSNASPL